jgi:hypothetical protein
LIKTQTFPEAAVKITASDGLYRRFREGYLENYRLIKRSLI